MSDSKCVAYGAGAEPSSTEAELTSKRLTIALAWNAARKARDKSFDSALLADPAWEILLNLYVCRSDGVSLPFGQLIDNSCVSQATVLRWLAALHSEGLIDNDVTSAEPRNRIATLTSEGLKKMDKALDSAAQSDAELGLGRLRVIR